MTQYTAYTDDAFRHTDPAKKADTVRQRELIQADASCKSCKHFSLRTGKCKLKAKAVKPYNCCKLHNLEILS